MVACCSLLSAEDVFSVFPLQAGNQWTYEHENRGGDRAHPQISRWITVTTVRGHATVPEGTVILRDTKLVQGQPNGGWIGTHGSFHYLLRQNCIYFLDRQEWDESAKRLRDDFRDILLRGQIAPDLCFPLEAGMHWRGNADHCSEWFMQGVVREGTAAAFVPDSVEAPDFHLFSPQACGGETGHRWFRSGTGITGEWFWHNGTYGELRVRLVKFQRGTK